MNSKQFIVIMLAVMFSFVVSSCDKNDSLLVNPEVESSVEPNEVVEKATTRAATSAISSIPSGWIERNSGVGVQALQKGIEKRWVIAVNLKQGAKMGTVFDYPVSGAETGDAKFTRKSISSWNDYGTFFACSNASFFDGRGNPYCKIPFPLKQGGIMFSYGNGGTQEDRAFEKIALVIDDKYQYAQAISIGKSPMNYVPLESAKKAYVGFVYSHGNDMDGKVGRIFVGLRDDDGDGKCEVILLLIVHGVRDKQNGLSHKVARKILSDEFSCSLSNIITFDGSGSSQLIVERDKKIEGDKRTFPVAFVVKEGSR